MRKIVVIPILFLSLFCLSCSTEEEEGFQEEQEKIENPEDPGEPENSENEDYSIASFSIGGEFTKDKVATKSEEEVGNDLFALQFYEVKTKKPYAYVLGDDISEVTVDFKTGHAYMLKMTYLKDAKDIIYHQGDNWGEPFHITGHLTAVWNETYYSSDDTMEKISAPYLNMKDIDGGLYVEVDRYHGIIEEFEITEEQANIFIELKRLVFGLSLEIEMEENDQEIYFSINAEYNPPREYIFPVVKGNGSFEIPYITLSIPNHNPFDNYLNDLDRAVMDDYEEKVHISIGTPDHYTLYFDDYITVKRNKMTVIELSPGEGAEATEGSFNINFEEEMMDKYIDLSSQ